MKLGIHSAAFVKDWGEDIIPYIKECQSKGYEVIEMLQFKPGANYTIFKKPGKQNPAVYKIDEISID